LKKEKKTRIKEFFQMYASEKKTESQELQKARMGAAHYNQTLLKLPQIKS